jgi:SAM-dependent methyltransferase
LGLRAIMKVWRKLFPSYIRRNVPFALFFKLYKVMDVLKLYSLNDIYDNRFFQWHLNSDMLSDTEHIVKLLFSRFRPKSVVDFGCGVASFLHYFQKLGVKDIYGYEGSSEAFPFLMVNPSFVEKKDLRNYVQTPRHFDLCICFEVLEHISPRFEDNLLSSLCNSSDTLCISVAQPNQRGLLHINLQPKEYWIQKLRERNFVYNREATNELRSSLEQRIRHIQWIPGNLMIFERQKT